jgi:hypothetical protein
MVPGKVPDTPRKLELVVAGEETMSLGECRYRVLNIRQKLVVDGELLDAWSDLYSPDLETTLAKRYDEGTTRELTVSYTRIRGLSKNGS